VTDPFNEDDTEDNRRLRAAAAAELGTPIKELDESALSPTPRMSSCAPRTPSAQQCAADGRSRRIAGVADRGLGRLSWADCAPSASERTGVPASQLRARIGFAGPKQASITGTAEHWASACTGHRGRNRPLKHVQRARIVSRRRGARCATFGEAPNVADRAVRETMLPVRQARPNRAAKADVTRILFSWSPWG
jgi:hypothetical protein